MQKKNPCDAPRPPPAAGLRAGAAAHACPAHRGPRTKTQSNNPFKHRFIMAKKNDLTQSPYVLITTKHRGVFAGILAEDAAPAHVVLLEARCAIKFGTTKGFMQLAESGPTSKSIIGSVVPQVRLFDITSITSITEEAKEKWESA